MSKYLLKLHFFLLSKTNNDSSVAHIHLVHLHSLCLKTFFMILYKTTCHTYFFVLSVVYIWQCQIKINNNLSKLRSWFLDLVRAKLSSVDWWRYRAFLDGNICFTFFSLYPKVLPAEMSCSHWLQTSLWIEKLDKYFSNDILSNVNMSNLPHLSTVNVTLSPIFS